MLRFLTATLLFEPSITLATRASNFDVSRATAESYQCGDDCYDTLQVTNAADLDVVGADFDWDFYAVADNFSMSKPGDLLKIKPVDPTNLTTISGVSVYRIQYTSEDLNGTYVPVSGYIALPFSLPNNGEFPLVAYAHGTIGLYRGCAISNGPNLFDYNSWSLLSERGYAIVGTDYAGLGTYGTDHKYCAFPAHAKDLYHSVTAARHAFGSVLSTSWMAVGHSQGGGAVWKLAEDIETIANQTLCTSQDQTQQTEACRNEADNYLGTVALAPATKIWDTIQMTVAQLLSYSNFHSSSGASLLPVINLGIKRLYPAYNSTLLGGLMKAPYEASCGDGNEVHLKLYPKQDHSGVFTAAAPDWLQWMDDRFNGKATEGECVKQIKQAFDYKNVRAEPEVDLSTNSLN
ncbi:Lipase secreted [Phytophthora megakarya]|uniref:Lipase secreted n=1 Tax=Phytophthora megakarya TaxID=4795 RepID=A0A225X2V7_9STRA|nr:Lipase secreted [Phytophthora megakarya]